MTATATELTEAQREKRRTQAHNAIRARLAETRKSWAPRVGLPDCDLAAALALDALGNTAAEILVDGTMMRSLTVKDGVVTLEIEEATELIKASTGAARGIFNEYGAENYVETQMEVVPADSERMSLSVDVRDGHNPTEAYTLTVQRRYRPTPHDFRQRAERERDDVLAVVGRWAGSLGNSVDVCALLQLLQEAGHTIPGAPAAAEEGAGDEH